MNYFRCDGCRFDPNASELSRYVACWNRGGVKIEQSGPSEDAAREALHATLKAEGIEA